MPLLKVWMSDDSYPQEDVRNKIFKFKNKSYFMKDPLKPNKDSNVKIEYKTIKFLIKLTKKNKNLRK